MDNARSPIGDGNTDRAFVIDLIRQTPWRHVPQVPESAINDLKREAQECCSLKHVIYMIKRSQKNYRSISVLRKYYMSWSGWKRGREFNMYEDDLLVTLTNRKNVSWLDLAEYTVDYGKYFPNGRSIARSAIRRIYELPRVLDVYDVEIRNPDCARQLRIYSQDYMKHIEKSMRCEMMYNAAVTLSRRWDNRRFARYTNSVDYMFRVNRDFHLAIFPRLLIQHCNDSKIVVSYFMLMSSDHPRAVNKAAEYIVRYMSLPCLHFFMLHIMNVVRAQRRQERFMCWITLHIGLIQKAFKMGENRTLELLLGFRWPYEFCFNFYEDSPVNKLNWPRKTVELSPWSYISPAFTAVLVLYLINNSKGMQTTIPCIADGIRLFWRSLPTPYVSLDDLQRLVKIMVKGNYDLRLIVTMHGNAKWAREFISFYPTDCLATYQPRSLLHLTRCKIRQLMDMMVNVKFLPLPNNLKEYLWLKW